MESLLPSENENLARLVTSTHFDSLKAIEIARHSDPWKNWGWKGYWDVMKTVWQINRDRQKSQDPLRLVGGGFKFDGPSYALVGIGELPVDAPWWEKLRAPWPIFQIVLFNERVEHAYARSVEREIFEKQERGIWWGGSSHSRIYQEWPQGTNGRLVRENRRMARLLYDRYGDTIAQIQLHNSPPAESTAIAELLEKALADANINQCGFDLARSPLTHLRDATAKHFQLQPGLSLGDVAPRYIFLEPLANQPRCDWISGYITEEMLAKYKPYYEGKIGHHLANVQEANQAFSVYKGW